MTHALPGIEQYEKLLPVTKELYEHTSHLAWQMLLPLFLVSIAIGYSVDLGIAGSVLVRLKRLFMVALLLVSFPMIAEFIQILGVEIAKSIDNMSGLDMILDAASKKADGYSTNLISILNMNNDFIMGALSVICFIILLFARFFLIAFQHFYWLLMIVLAPFMILATLFESAAGVTKSLFKNMLQIAAWPIIWSVLSAFLKAMPFVSVYEAEGGPIAIITLNLLLAVALLFSPFIVSQLCDGVSLSVGDTLRKGALKAVTAMNPKAGIIANKLQKMEKFNQGKNIVNKK